MSIPKLYQVGKDWLPPSDEKPKVLAWDTETIGNLYDWDFQVVCLSWCTEQGVGYVALWKEVPQVVLDWLEDPAIIKTGHNIKYDCKALSQVTGKRCYSWPFRDTRHMWSLVDESAKDDEVKNLGLLPSLKVLARRTGFLRWTAAQERFFEERKLSAKKSWSEQPNEILLAYGCCDSVAQLQLHETLWNELDEGERRHLNFLMQVERSLIDMELDGFKLDKAQLAEKLQTAINQEAILANQLMGMSGLTKLSASSPQLSKYLFQTLGLTPLASTQTGRHAVNRKVLALMLKDSGLPEQARAFIEKLLELRRIEATRKQCGTYLAAVHMGGLIHAEGNLSGTVTGRLSMRPNAQNPGRQSGIRDCFVTRF
jgi:DNA polymerase-1